MAGLTVAEVNRRLLEARDAPPLPEPEAPDTGFSIEDINRRLGALPDIPALPGPRAPPVELSVEDVNARLASFPVHALSRPWMRAALSGHSPRLGER